MLGGVALVTLTAVAPPPASARSLAEFARCLRRSGATFWGAEWCPQCAAQERVFGRAVGYLDYVECAQGATQTPACIDAGIAVYPTWTFGDGSRVVGRQSLESLARRTGCSVTAAPRAPTVVDVRPTVDARTRRDVESGVQFIEIP